MYGQVTTSGAGATLAATGVSSGSMLLMAIGLTFLGAAMVTIVNMTRHRDGARP
jgi:hypothetical protein